MKSEAGSCHNKTGDKYEMSPQFTWVLYTGTASPPDCEAREGVSVRVKGESTTSRRVW